MSKTKTADSQKVIAANEKTKHLMEEMPVWKSLLKTAVPSLILMLVMGGYMFADNILAIQLAPDSYGGSKDLVRMGMSAFSPVNALISAFAMLFGMGISTRVSINLGANRTERAKNTLKTGFMIGMAVSLVLIPILMFSAKPWMASQYADSSAETLSDMGFDYGWIIIMAAPVMFFNQIIAGLFRVEGRMKAMMIPMVVSVGLNLLFDWIFMGPVGMGIEGGAWATFISSIFVTVVYIVIMLRKDNSLVKFNNLFGFKFKAVAIIGIILVGIAPFLRNFAQSITQTFEMNVIKDVSGHVYAQSGQIGSELFRIAGIDGGSSTISIQELLGLFKDPDFLKAKATANSDTIYAAIDHYSLGTTNPTDFKLFSKSLVMAAAFDPTILPDPTTVDPALLTIPAIAKAMTPVVTSNQMTLILTGVFPIFGLFFPTIFAFAQAGKPLASYNFGAKNLSRVKQTFWYTVIYSTVAGIIVYFIAAFALADPLMSVLGVSDVHDTFGTHESTAERAATVLKIMMISLPMFGFAIGGMVLTGSTDRVVSSIIVSSLRGFIFFFPAIYIFKAIGIAAPEQEFLFWWFYPALAGASVITSFLISMIVLKRLDKKVTTLDDKLNTIYSKIENRKWLKRKAK